MIHETNLVWKGNMAFETELDGHLLRVDAGVESGGDDSGMRPKKLMLTALSGCTGMDIVSILKKMKIEIEGLNIKVNAPLTDEQPKHYSSMHIIYEFKGSQLPIEKLRKAIDLSREKYCGVLAVYNKAIDVTYEIVLLE